MMAKHTRAVTSSIAAVPVALGLLAPATNTATGTAAGHTTRHVSRTTAAPKEFSIPMANLKAWTEAVVVTMNNVRIEGHSPVHPLNNDCEMHFGAHSTAFRILDTATVDVTRGGAALTVSFFGGTMGNFTVLDVQIDRASITGDGAGSFRMTGDVVTNDTTVPVRLVSIKGTAMNDAIGKLRSTSSAKVSLQALVLFSLSPEALLDAANKSNGNAQSVQTPIQLILYGTPDDKYAPTW